MTCRPCSRRGAFVCVQAASETCAAASGHEPQLDGGDAFDSDDAFRDQRTDHANALLNMIDRHAVQLEPNLVAAITAQTESSFCALQHSSLVEAVAYSHCAINHIAEPIDATAITPLTDNGRGLCNQHKRIAVPLHFPASFWNGSTSILG